VFASTAPAAAEASVDGVIDRLSHWSGRVGAEQEDDLTIVRIDIAWSLSTMPLSQTEPPR